MRRSVICVLALAAGCAGAPAALEDVPAQPARVSITVEGPGAVFVPALHSTCHGTCSFPAQPGVIIHLQVASDAQATFSGWSGACAGNGPCDVIAADDIAVGATFSPGS
jgi:hypothetical protein